MGGQQLYFQGGGLAAQAEAGGVGVGFGAGLGRAPGSAPPPVPERLHPREAAAPGSVCIHLPRVPARLAGPVPQPVPKPPPRGPYPAAGPGVPGPPRREPAGRCPTAAGKQRARGGHPPPWLLLLPQGRCSAGSRVRTTAPNPTERCSLQPGSPWSSDPQDNEEKG